MSDVCVEDINEKESPEIIELRRKNLEEKNAFLASLFEDPEFIETSNYLNKLAEERKNNERNRPKTVKRRSYSSKDSSFRFTGHIPLEKRSSSRLLNKKPQFSYTDLPDELGWQIKRKSKGFTEDDLHDNLEEVVFNVKRRRTSYGRRPAPPHLPVEDVTDAMIANIHLKGNKVYGREDATSCHQCRQKTSDQKTVCRSGSCVGIRGQFCGICVVQRYGEDPAKALRDPNWTCYVCRGCCNCSFCRAKAGKRPTGILVPIAKSNGFKSVHDFLSNLKGFGDFPNNDDIGVEDDEDDARKLVGFDGDYAVLSGGDRVLLSCDYDDKIWKNEITQRGMPKVVIYPLKKKLEKKRQSSFKIKFKFNHKTNK